MATEAFVTLATNDTYAIGTLVLAHSLKHVETSKHLVVLITEGVSEQMKKQLETVFDVVQTVSLLDSQDTANLALMSRPELGITFTKLHCWKLIQYSKCVFMDADTLVLSNCDELFEREEFSAAPDVGWPDCFNSGVFVYSPSEDTYQKLVQTALEKGSFDGGDQGLLNSYFSDWSTKDIRHILPFIYNMCSSATYTYLPAYNTFGKNVKVVHFLGNVKPWHYQYSMTTGHAQSPSGSSFHHQDHVYKWWHIFMKHVQPQLQPDCSGLAGNLAKMSIEPQTEAEISVQRKMAWERGQMDYLGEDSFENIQKRLDKAIETEEV